MPRQSSSKVLQALLLLTSVCLAQPIVAGADNPSATWDWLFPFERPAADSAPAAIHRLPGSTQSFTTAQLHDLGHAVDWLPEEHPPMPGIVAAGHGDANACGFCHLPTGNGRPENSSLAGLPVDYIKRQVRAFADGSRRSALPGKPPALLMAATAKGVSADEIEQAATYYSSLKFVSYVQVVESDTAAFTAGPFVYVLKSGSEQPIAERLIEAPLDNEAFEERDPHARYVAYVPKGALAMGKTLVTTGGDAGQPCTTCHGDGLRGGIAPPLAGRSPTSLLRQLVAFKLGARSNPEAAPMRAICGSLDEPALIALAAYIGSLGSLR